LKDKSREGQIQNFKKTHKSGSFATSKNTAFAHFDPEQSVQDWK